MKIEFPGVIGTIDVYMDCLRAICGDTAGRSMIDLACCFAPNTPQLGFKKRKYIDVIDRNLDHAEEQQFFEKKDILAIDPYELVYRADMAFCLDGIEHLYLQDGYKLIDLMERIAIRQIIFTPLDNIFGIAMVGDKNPESHKSLWHPCMLPGYASIVFPDYHKVYGGGAFFAFKTPSTRYHLDKAWDELKTKPWAK